MCCQVPTSPDRVPLEPLVFPQPAHPADPSHFRIAVGRHLRQRRLALGYSLEGMAASLGVSKSTLSVWERGDRAMTLDHLAALCQALHTTPEELLDRGENHLSPG